MTSKTCNNEKTISDCKKKRKSGVISQNEDDENMIILNLIPKGLVKGLPFCMVPSTSTSFCKLSFLEMNHIKNFNKKKNLSDDSEISLFSVMSK